MKTDLLKMGVRPVQKEGNGQKWLGMSATGDQGPVRAVAPKEEEEELSMFSRD